MKQVERLKKLISENLSKSKTDIQNRFGSPTKKSDHSIWFYSNFTLSPMTFKTAFIFEEDIVVDIFIYEYFFGIEIKNIFYYEGENPEFKEISFF